MKDFIRGYDPTTEQLGKLRAASSRYDMQCSSGQGLDELILIDKVPFDLQGRRPSCVGFGGTHTLESLQFLQTGRIEQLSPMWSWVESQRIDGRPSPKEGASIWAFVEVAKTIGVPREELAPYRDDHWYTDFSDEAKEDAKKYMVRSSYELDSYEKMRDFLASGMGAIICGVPWEGDTKHGWHCLAILGFRRDGTLIGPNSWPQSVDQQGPKDGWFEWSESKVNWYLNFRGSIFFGLSDLSTPQVREARDWGSGEALC